MTKQTAPAATVTTDLTPVGEAALVLTRPASMVLIGTMLPTLHKVAAAIRIGYVPSDMQVFGPTGQIQVMLSLGDPDISFVEDVQTDMAEALEREHIQNEQAIEAAAIRLIAEREKAAKQAEIAAAIAEQEKTLRALKRQQVAAA